MFTDPAVQRLWDAGRILAAYEASSEPAAISSEHPFRDQHLLLSDAQQWHERGVLCWYNARDAEAETTLARAHELRRKILGPDHPDTLDTAERQAVAARSIAKLKVVVERLVAVFGDQHLRVAIARRNLAATLRNASRFQEAREVLNAATPVIESSLPVGHADVVALLKVDALLCTFETDYDASLARANRAIELGQGLWNEAHPFIASAELIVVAAEHALSKHKRARQRLPWICERIEAAYGEHPILAVALWTGARIDLAAQYGLLEADRDLRRAIEIFRVARRPATAFELTLFEILFYSGRTIEAGEYAEAIFDAATKDAQYHIANSLERAFSRAAWRAQARRWAQRAHDASPDDELRAEWAKYLEASNHRDT